jgi:hypothetical protein
VEGVKEIYLKFQKKNILKQEFYIWQNYPLRVKKRKDITRKTRKEFETSKPVL